MACQRNQVKNAANISVKKVAPMEKPPVDSLIFQDKMIRIYKIDSIGFFKEQQQADYKRDTIASISDIKVAKKLLQGRVKFGGYAPGKAMEVDTLVEGNLIAQVRFNNGRLLEAGKTEGAIDLLENMFVKYFPSEEILLLEGGHTTDQALDLRQGKWDIEEIGNLDYVYFSKHRKYRLNGMFNGQECSSYFLQKRENGSYLPYAQIPLDWNDNFELCTLKEIFWKGDQQVYFRNFFYGAPHDQRAGFYRLDILSKD
ncbi:hypothetical protein [Sphingobacterium sp. HMA12]|uniref:hypothetical protein n=1 Tax=Sphingobacterium sp. HMA12 TaxID=2050894 RepID=UPI000CE9F9C1|nr:hypothetical protein [Sphingobacterium sp. HMA12]